MERKRICEDCGNICNDVNCPICGRKTKVYAGSRQEDTLYDASKYRMSDNTGCTKKEQKKKDVFEQKARMDDDGRTKEHRFNHVGGKNLRLRMEKGGHPYYEHVRAGKNQYAVTAVHKLSAFLLGVIIIAVIAIVIGYSNSHNEEAGIPDYGDEENQGFVSGNISMHEVNEKVDLTCMVMDYGDVEGAQIVIVENTSPYLVKSDLMKGDETVGYLSLPANSNTETLIYDAALSSCDNKIYGVYEMELEKPQVAYTLTTSYNSEYELDARIDVRKRINEDQLETLLRYLYSQASAADMYNLNDVGVHYKDDMLYRAVFDYTKGSIEIESTQDSAAPYTIYIEN